MKLSRSSQVLFALALTIILPFVLRLIPRDRRPWVAYSDSIESPFLSSMFNISIVFLASEQEKGDAAQYRVLGWAC